MRERGFTIIELVICTMLIGFVMFFIFRHLIDINRMGSQNIRSEGTDFQVISLSEQIDKVGRVSQQCNRVNNGNNQELRCQIDLNRPSTGVFSWVRFILVGSHVEYQRDSSGTGNFTGTPTILLTYPNVSQFVVCDDTDMNLATVGTCPIEPLEMSRVRTATIGTKAGRFFRYSITEQSTSSLVGAPSSVFQGAFFIRNPTTSWAPNVQYSW